MSPRRQRSLVFVVPGSIETLTGGYGYDRQLLAGLRRRDWAINTWQLTGDFPFPSEMSRAAAGRALATLATGTLVVADGLAFGALPIEVERAAAKLTFVALVHHPLALETGLDPTVAAGLEDSERRALRVARRVVVTSRATAAELARFDVDPARVVVIEPGTDTAPQATGSKGDVIELLCVGTLSPRKGHDILFEALAGLKDLPWHLTCAGSLDRHADTVAALRAQLGASGLDDRVVLAGELARPALDALYLESDVFVLPTWFEGYGMAVAEALARGLPVVSTATGAIGDLVGTDAGMLVPPGDVPALTAALARVIGDAALRSRLAEGARTVRSRLPTWDDAAKLMEDALDGLDG